MHECTLDRLYILVELPGKSSRNIWRAEKLGSEGYFMGHLTHWKDGYWWIHEVAIWCAANNAICSELKLTWYGTFNLCSYEPLWANIWWKRLLTGRIVCKLANRIDDNDYSRCWEAQLSSPMEAIWLQLRSNCRYEQRLWFVYQIPWLLVQLWRL